ncbi:UNVERIFIED_ORG: hypothetical protein ABIB52_000722 [Arthrobacter sp. UYCu721]
MFEIHAEDALFNAGASDGYYEIVGASYTPGDGTTGGSATIDLSTMDRTGCLLTHDYGTRETVLKWDSDGGEELYGSADDVQTAIEDITRGQLDHRALFEAFQIQMTAGRCTPGTTYEPKGPVTS